MAFLNLKPLFFYILLKKILKFDIIYVACKMKGEIMIPASNSYKKYKRIWNYLGASLLLFYTIFMAREFVCVAVESFFKNAVSDKAGEIAYSLLGAFMYMLAFIVPVFFYNLISRRLTTFGDLQLEPKFNKYLLLVIPAALAANLVLAMINSLIMLPFNYEVIYDLMTPEYPDGYYLYHLVLDVIGTAIVPAISEELLFRGLILVALLPYGKKTAILGSSVMFAIMHQNFGQIVYTFGMGIVLALIVVKTQSVWGAIILHFLNNLFSVANTSLYYLYPTTKADFISNIMVLVVLVAGAACLGVLVYKYVKSDRMLVEEEYDEDDYDVCECSNPLSENMPISKKEKIKGFFAPLNIVFIALALFQMLLLLAVAVLEIPLS